MTSGERMIWAAAYVQEVARVRDGRAMLGEHLTAYGTVSRAAEYACGCVEDLRTAIPTLTAGYNETSTLEMALEMLGKEG